MYPTRPQFVRFNQPHPMHRINQRHPNPGPGWVPRHRLDNPRYGIPQSYRGPPPPMRGYKDEHWCETCDRGFPSLDILENHKKQHQKCNIDGCQFIAHPKVITKHIQMQHSTGLFKKICNLKNPEDIQKWRQERKKKYPTKENVEKKAAELKEKLERGEKMGLRREKRNYNNTKNGENLKRRHDNFDSKKNTGPYNSINKSKTSNKKPRNDKLPSLNDIRKLKPFAGIQDLLMLENEADSQELEDNCKNYEIEDDDEDCIIKANNDLNAHVKEPPVCSALSNLICDYGSSDEEVDALKKDNSQSSTQQINLNQIKKQNMHKSLYSEVSPKSDANGPNNATIEFNTIKQNGQEYESDNDGAPEELKVEKQITNEKFQEEKLKTRSKLPNIKPVCQLRRSMKQTKPKAPSTLLRKLLHKEIQQERNIVLQCIRYIVKNNYFNN